MNKLTTTLLGLAVIAVLVQPASAQLTQPVIFHGFGQVNYGKTDGNPFLSANENGTYQNFRFLLDITAVVGDRLTIKAVPEWEQETEGNEFEEEVEIDVAWAQYRISDGVGLRIGRSRTPYGEYGEVLENGTLRPFYSLPLGIYGRSGIVAEAYQGMGLQGTHFGDSGWGIEWDIFGGHMAVGTERGPEESLEEDPLAPPEEEEEEEEEETEFLDNVIGGHVSFLLPGDRVAFGLGAFSGDVTEEGKRHTSLIGSLSYNTEQLHARGELGYHTETAEKNVIAWYLELAYKTPSGVQVGARYDALDYKFLEVVDVMPGAESAVKHKDISFLLGYWFRPEFVIKAELHLVDGNFFAHDEGFGERLEAGGVLNNKTTAFIIGSQFSF